MTCRISSTYRVFEILGGHLEKLGLQLVQESAVIRWGLATFLLGLAIDDERIDDRHIDETQKQRLVVLVHADLQLKGVPLESQLVVNIYPAHPALVVAHGAGHCSDTRDPPRTRRSERTQSYY